MTNNISGSTTPLQVTVHPLSDSSSSQFWSGDAPTFKDVLDTINPLQHIPIISSLYQSLTGDEPSSGADVAGGTLFGGPIGLLSSVFNEIVKTQTGKDVTGSLLALVTGESSIKTADASYAPSPVNKAAYNAYQQTQSLIT